MKKNRSSKRFSQKKVSLPLLQTKSRHLQGMLNRLVPGKRQGEQKTALEQALEAFAVSDDLVDMNIPDYSGFADWIAKLVEADPARTLVYRRTSSLVTSTSNTLGVLEEMYALKNKYMQLLEGSKGGEAGSEELNVLGKFKLLMSFSRGTVRAVEVSEARSKEVPIELEKGLSSCSQADLRVRLFAATDRKEWRIAFKIIGRLKEESHDEGELAFLEAMAYFHSDDLEGCILYASSVTKDHIDYSGAKALHLECLAYLGREKELLNLLNALRPSKLSPMFMLYLGQLLVLNAEDPLQAVANLSKVAEDSSCTERSMSLDQDPFFLEFNRHSCSLALRLAEWLSSYGVSEGLKPNEFQNAAERLDTNYRSVIALQVFDPLLAEAVMEASVGQAFVPIVKRLLNGSQEKQSVDYAQALETQLRLGAIDIFVPEFNT